MKSIKKKKLDYSFSVAFNGDVKLIEQLENYPVDDVYGKLHIDIFGGGRSPKGLKEISKENLKYYVKEVQKKSMRFNYILNTTCLNNREFDSGFNNQMLNFIQWLYDIGIRLITVAIPYLVKIIKLNFPQIRIKASKMSRISTVTKATLWQEIGADEMCLDGNIIRNFQMLEKIRKNCDAKLEILANDSCLINCPFDNYHNQLESHASQIDNTAPYVSYCTLNCKKIFLENPGKIIGNMFIRPEDIDAYREIGINKFKILDRLKSTAWIINVVKAYSERKYNGNLADLLPLFSGYDDNKHISDVDIEKSIASIQNASFKGAFSVRPYIDNTKLNGFITYFKNNKCNEENCGITCNYCNNYAKKILRFADKDKNIALKNINKALTIIDSCNFVND